MDYVTPRKRFVGWLRQQLIGPANPDEDTLVGLSPLERYPVGVLYPVEPGTSGLDPADALLPEAPEEASAEDSEPTPLAQPTRTRRYVPPSSVGFSFFVRGAARLCVTISSASYKRAEERDERGRFIHLKYQRQPIDETTWLWMEDDWQHAPDDPRFNVDVRRRRVQDGWIFTLTLYNRQQWDPRSRQRSAQARAELSLFEARLACIVEAGELIEYPRADRSLLTEEEQEIELQYRDKRIYAIGHGAAVNWRVEKGCSPRIQTEFIPEVEVPLVTTDLPGAEQPVLGMHYLATAPRASVVTELERFVAGYAQWVEAQGAAVLAARERAPAERIQTRMRTAVTRMRRGIRLLGSDATVEEAFRLANRAMLSQMRQRNRIRGQVLELAAYRWRPFQLAFWLVTLESAVREDSPDRDVLDLIWFPTGGGKTEAYLVLTAFLILWRRLTHAEAGGGTVALMRYTLRLLTTQQFQRATLIIFALELLRRAQPERLGAEPISVGIWVGRANSPNTYHQAAVNASEISAGAAPPHGLVLAACPWCGAAFEARNYCAGALAFRFVCANPECEFLDRALPCNVVDEALYDQPPTLLIGTIDKFARLAWEERAGKFFGCGTTYRPPELVIQDELHLITGPLGSVAGLYEAALDALLRVRGARPKYVASTATIRMAMEQAQRLYGRELAVFPPPGLSCDDSYFARADHARPGRLYIGYLAPALGQRQCLGPLAAALLVGPQTLFEEQAEGEALLEAWWTQVVYHISLHSVGHSHSAYVMDVRDWTRRLSQELAALNPPAAEENGALQERPDRRVQAERTLNPRIAQLTSFASAQENAATFGRLEKRFGDPGHLDVVLATNMVSVGLDVARLALMVINGQPMTTAEYIQASSRVGRADVPGLVFANYHRHQARSLSHYENFRPYHESFYRFVEPTSVTPYTYQVRARALHAALVIALRHASDHLRGNKKAGTFDPHEPRTRAVIETFKRRCAQAEGNEAGRTRDHIERLAEQWRDEALRCEQNSRALHYRAQDRSVDALLCDPLEPEAGLWPTLHSMRNVESTGLLKVA